MKHNTNDTNLYMRGQETLHKYRVARSNNYVTPDNIRCT